MMPAGPNPAEILPDLAFPTPNGVAPLLYRISQSDRTSDLPNDIADKS